MASFEDIIFSKTARIVWIILGIIIVGGLIFDAGLAIGVRSALRGPHRGSPGVTMAFGFSLPHGFIPGGNGAVGTITGISSSALQIQTRDGNTESIAAGSSTVIREGSDTVSLSALKVGESIVVIGDPEGEAMDQVMARFIRVVGQ